MQVRREYLASLKEEELCKEILVPLFRGMGYRDVFHYHGGVLEQGKDIVMWKWDDLGVRQNWGVVVKAKDVTGKISGSSSAGEVAHQIKQCFSHNFRDTTSGEERRIDRCMVVSSKRIKKEALESISNILQGGPAERTTQFINGTRLWELVERHLPAATVWQRLTDVKEVLDGISDNYNLSAQTTSSGIKVELDGLKNPDAAQPTIKASLSFPDTDDAKQAKKAFADFIDYGSSVTLESKYVTLTEVPDFFKTLFAGTSDQTYEIQLGSRRGMRSLSATLKATHRDESASLAVILDAVRVGRKRLQLSNEAQNIPWKVRIVLELENPRAELNIHREDGGWNVKGEYDAVSLLELLCAGADLTLTDATSGLHLFSGSPGLSKQTGPQDGWREFLGAVLTIQVATGTAIEIPDRDIRGEEVQTAFEIAAKIERGQFEVSASTVALELSREGLENLIKESEERGELPLFLRHDEEVQILNTPIQMGSVEHVFFAELAPEEAKAIHKHLSERSDEYLSVTLDVSSKPTSVRYLRFLEADRDNP